MDKEYLKQSARGARTLRQPPETAAAEFETRREEPVVLAETALWVFRTDRSQGFAAVCRPGDRGAFVAMPTERLSNGAFVVNRHSPRPVHPC